jgi:D-xylose transport system substrate-binding protein
MRSRFLLAAAAVGGLALLTGCTTGADQAAEQPAAASAEELTGTVTLLLPNTTTTRFIEHDAPAFVEAMGELAPGITVDVQNADGDASRQLTQAETAISQGTEAIVFVSADPALSGSVLAKASDALIPVIGYEHEALDGEVAYQVIFDPFKVGAAQGTYFGGHLPETATPVKVARVYGNNGDNYTTQVKAGQDDTIDGLVADGSVEVVCEDYAAGWDPANAQKIVEQCLTKTQNQIDAVLVSNDGTASGAIAALEGQNLGGTVPVYGGQDANLDGLKYILQGKQQDTVFKNYAVEGQSAAELVIAALLKQDPPSGLVNDVFDNNSIEVPAAFLDVESIDAENMQTVVDAGLYTKEEICEGLSGVAFCDAP